MSSDQQVYLIIGVGLLLSSLVMFVKTRKFVSTALRAKGEIIKYGYETGGHENGRQLLAVVQYSVNNKNYTCTSMMFNKKTHYLGKHMDVLYDKANPNHGQVDSILQLHFIELITLSIGVAALFFLFMGR